MSLTELENLIKQNHIFSYEESIPVLAHYIEKDPTTFALGLAMGIATCDHNLDTEELQVVETLVTKDVSYDTRALPVLSYLFEDAHGVMEYHQGLLITDVIVRAYMVAWGYPLDAVLNIPPNYDIDSWSAEWFDWLWVVIDIAEDFVINCSDEGIDCTSVNLEDYPVIPEMPRVLDPNIVRDYISNLGL